MVDLGFEQDTHEVAGKRAVLLLQQTPSVRTLALGLRRQGHGTT